MRFPGDILEIEIDLDTEEFVALLAQAPHLLSFVAQVIAQSQSRLLSPSPAHKESSNGKTALPLGLVVDALRAAQAGSAGQAAQGLRPRRE